MKFKNSFIDLTKSSGIDKLAEIHRQQSLESTQRYQCKTLKFWENEFHPLWHTFIKSDNSLEVKVNIRSFNKELKQLEFSDFMWFDLKVKEKSIEAVCQVDKRLRFVLATDMNATYI